MSDVHDRAPTYVELESVQPLPAVSKITNLSEDTIRRKYRQYLVKLSERRTGMKLRHALAIASGTINTAA